MTGLQKEDVLTKINPQWEEWEWRGERCEEWEWEERERPYKAHSLTQDQAIFGGPHHLVQDSSPCLHQSRTHTGDQRGASALQSTTPTTSEWFHTETNKQNQLLRASLLGLSFLECEMSMQCLINTTPAELFESCFIISPVSDK